MLSGSLRLLALVSIYQLLFTFFAEKVEKDARTYAKGDVRLERAYLIPMKGEVVYNVLFKKYTYRICVWKGNQPGS